MILDEWTTCSQLKQQIIDRRVGLSKEICVSGSYFLHFSKSSIFSVRTEKCAEKWMGVQKSKSVRTCAEKFTFLYATPIHFSALFSAQVPTH